MLRMSTSSIVHMEQSQLRARVRMAFGKAVSRSCVFKMYHSSQTYLNTISTDQNVIMFVDRSAGSWNRFFVISLVFLLRDAPICSTSSLQEYATIYNLKKEISYYNWYIYVLIFLIFLSDKLDRITSLAAAMKHAITAGESRLPKSQSNKIGIYRVSSVQAAATCCDRCQRRNISSK